ncbi:MAG: hypothetical protein WC728_12150 [Elusimicrobiota bacterium]
MTRRLALSCLALLFGCAPRPLVTHPKFSFEPAQGWAGPIEVPGGVEFRSAATKASMAVSFIPAKGSPVGDEASLRRRLASLGSVEDTVLVETLEYCGRKAFRARYTTHYYDPEYRLGEKEHVLFSEATAVPFDDGVYLVRFQAPKAEFGGRRYRALRARFLRSVSLGGPEASLSALAAGKGDLQAAIEAVTQRQAEEKKRDKASRLVGRTLAHARDAKGKTTSLFSFFARRGKGLRTRARGIDKVAVVSFVGEFTSQAFRHSSGGASLQSVSSYSTVTETRMKVSKDLKRAILSRMLETFVAKLRQYDPQVAFLSPERVWGHPLYANLPYAEAPTEQMSFLFFSGPKKEAEGFGVSAEGFKYLRPPVAESATDKEGMKRQLALDDGFDEFGEMMGELARALDVDAVITVQNELEFVPRATPLKALLGVVGLYWRDWAIELKDISVNLWGRDGSVLWSGKIERSKLGVSEALGSTTGEGLWEALEGPYARGCEYLALKFDEDRQ